MINLSKLIRKSLIEEKSEISDSKFTVHDKYRFELKLDIELASDQKSSSYRIETFFFMPKALNISPFTYNKDKFYTHAQQFVRFKIPQISLKMMIDPTVATSPVSRIDKTIPQFLSGSKNHELIDYTYSEIRLLGAIVRGSIKDAVKYLTSEFTRHKNQGNLGGLKDIETFGINFIEDLKNLRIKLKEQKDQLSNPLVPVKLRDAYVFCDEFISISIQDFLGYLIENIRENPDLGTSLDVLENALVAAFKDQINYHKTMGYPSAISKGSDNSTFTYRKGILKKFVSAPLYLNVEVSELKGWAQFLFGIAAGVSMLFAAVVTLFAQNKYTTNSWPFIAIIVIGYIFKDRIKDWLRVFFSHSIVRWLADRKIKIKDPLNNKTIGYFKETFGFIKPNDVPGEIRQKRNMDNITSIDEDGKPERVMCYEKRVTLFPEKISRFHERRRDIIDIMRLNIREFIAQADDPSVDYITLNQETNQLEHVSCERTYHMNIITRYDSNSSTLKYERNRLTLNRNGIKNLEEVSGG